MRVALNVRTVFTIVTFILVFAGVALTGYALFIMHSLFTSLITILLLDA